MLQHRITLAFSVLCILCAVTIARSTVYEDEVSLYSDVVAKSPDKARPHNNLGDALKKANRFEEAGPRFERALEIQPVYPDALNNLATIYGSSGRKQEALQLLGEALAYDPGHRQARFNLAIMYYEQGMQEEAAQQYAILIQLAPLSKEGVFARTMLGMIQRGSR